MVTRLIQLHIRAQGHPAIINQPEPLVIPVTHQISQLWGKHAAKGAQTTKAIIPTQGVEVPPINLIIFLKVKSLKAYKTFSFNNNNNSNKQQPSSTAWPLRSLLSS